MNKSNLISAVLVILLLVSLRLFSQTIIHGEIGDKVLIADGNPHVVDSVLTVSAGKTLVIKAGVHFVFNPFTGLDVHGDILIEGTKEKPVIFTSINDVEYSDQANKFPAAFDWNGIRIENREGEAVFKNFKVMFSVFGLKSKNRNIVLHNGTFKQNGQYNFTIHDKVLEVPDNLVFFYNSQLPDNGDDSSPHEPDPEKKKRRVDRTKLRKIIGSAVAGTGFIGCVAGGYFAHDAGVQYTKYNDTPPNLIVLRRLEYEDYEQARINSAVNFSLGLTLLSTGAGLFFWDEIKTLFKKFGQQSKNNRETKTIRVATVVLNQGGSIQIICSF